MFDTIFLKVLDVWLYAELQASLVLHKTEVVTLKQAFRQLMEENKQIRTDNRDVNKRAAILAQEIDERHAALESTTRNEVGNQV